MLRRYYLVMLCAGTLAISGCASKHIVSSAPPSVSSVPPEEPAAGIVPVVPPPVETPSEPPAETPPAVPPLAPVKRPSPPRPRSTQPETADPAPAKPAAPQISPQLSAQDLAAAKSRTTANITTAEKNLQLVNGKRLSAAQKDLTEKISGFLGQAHEAILADDWVRAQNLADKARVLAAELVKSL